MSKKGRELFLLFQPQNIMNIWCNEKEKLTDLGYQIVYRHTFPNDEPPYIMVTYWGIGVMKLVVADLEETVSHYLVRLPESERLVDVMNDRQNSYLSWYLEGVLTRNAGEHNLSAHEVASRGIGRGPKLKYIYDLPEQFYQK